MHITFVLESFYPTHRAGTETYVLNLALGLLEQGWQVSVIVAAVGSKSSTANYKGVTVYALSVPTKISTHELNGLTEPSNLIEFKALLHKIAPEIVHFHSFSRSFSHPHIKAAHRHGAKIFFTAHLGNAFCARNDLLLYGKKQCNAKIEVFRCTACFASVKHNKTMQIVGGLAANVLPYTALRKKLPALNLIHNKLRNLYALRNYVHTNIAIAKWIKKAYLINHIANTKILTQAINTAPFAFSNKPFTEGKLQLGFIGRTNPSKGLHVLLKTLEINELYKQIELHVITIQDVSEPIYYEQVRAKFSELGYNSWKENLSHTKINTEMDNWDMLVLPSTANEAAPLVILEAFAKGLPVLGSDYPAIAEMITHNHNGLLFKNGNSKQLAEILTKLVTDHGKIPQLKQNVKPPKDIKQLVSEHIKLYTNNSKIDESIHQ